jgi:hypothetical protein
LNIERGEDIVGVVLTAIGAGRCRRGVIGHISVYLIVHLFHEIECLEHLRVGERVLLEQLQVALQEQVVFGDAEHGQLQVRCQFQAVTVFEFYFL